MLSSDTGVSRSNTHKKVSSHGTGMFASHIRSSSSENGFSAADGSSCIRVLCYPQGRPGLGFRLLASLWPSPGWCRYLGNKLVDRNWIINFPPPKTKKHFRTSQTGNESFYTTHGGQSLPTNCCVYDFSWFWCVTLVAIMMACPLSATSFFLA